MLTEAAVRTEDGICQTFLLFGQYSEHSRGELNIYRLGDQVAIHAQGSNGGIQSVYFPLGPLYMEVRPVGR